MQNELFVCLKQKRRAKTLLFLPISTFLRHWLLFFYSVESDPLPENQEA
jgi:hypothetical protein